MKENFQKNLPAGIFQRFIANLIDLILATFIASIISIIIFEILNLHDAIMDFIPIPIPLLYFLLKDSLPFLNGQSIGKKAIGLKVVDFSTGAPLTSKYGKNIIRELFQFIPVLNLIDALSIFSNTRQRLADKLVNTHVIKL